MSTSTTKRKQQVAVAEKAPDLEEKIRIESYLHWERQTGGNIVDQEQTDRFWLETEQRILAEAVTGKNGNGNGKS